MSVKHTQQIACLKCKKKSDFEFYGSINTMLDPTLKQRVKNFDIFKFICPHCGSEQFVNYSFLYHQMEDKLMIFYCQDEEEVAKVRSLYADDFDTALNAQGESETIDTTGYRRRIVIGADNLVEKIRIFDAGLDDRLVEIYKVLLYGQMQAELAEMPGGDAVDDVFVDEQLDGSLNFVFVADGRAVGAVAFSQDVYEVIANQYRDAVERLAPTEPVINQDWAFDILAQIAQEV